MEAWTLSIKPTFLNEWMALPPKEVAQIQKKLTALSEDPTPDAKVKKQLKYLDGKLHRLRSGDFRIFYTFEKPFVSVLALRRRDDQTYDEDLDADFLGGPSAEQGGDLPATKGEQWQRWLEATPPPKSASSLPKAITKQLLISLKIPEAFHAALVAVANEDDLLDCVSVPDDVRTRVIDALYERPLTEIVQQPDLVLNEADDLIRYKEGELLGFLLRLNPEQEKFVGWGANAKGPTLLKGGPGTGKSTVALYRARVFVEKLRKEGVERPQVLFTTYTKALTRVSEQLLESLLGADAACVEVRTADKICMDIAKESGATFTFAERPQLVRALDKAIETAGFPGNSLQKASQRRTVESVSRDYLLDEILGVIEARSLGSEEEYQAAARPGRRRPLNKTQRTGIWTVRTRFLELLAQQSLHTWEDVRARAAKAVESKKAAQRYDAIIVDEAQDLEPSALRALVGLCKRKNTLFLTADVNQSIYGSGFRWTDVHGDLKFQGRTGVLRANHRSTKEIGEAAHDYLKSGALDDEAAERSYVNNGPMPAVRAVADERDEVRLLARFFRGAARDLRLGLGSCAVLCPFKDDARRIAFELAGAGVEAEFTTAENLDLKNRGVKVITLKSAKGLEFPIVALAGFLSGKYPILDSNGTAEERAEAIAQERRSIFVAMTRPMRALLVVTPPDPETELLRGFSAEYWNLGAS